MSPTTTPPVRPRTLTEALRARSEAELVALLRRRPDLTYPLPRDVAELANRATTFTSVNRALDELDAWHRLVAEALAALPDPCTLDELTALVADEAAAVAAAVDELRTRALVWGGPDQLHLVRTAREAFDPYPAGLAPPSPRPLSPSALEAALAECTPEMRTVLDRLLYAPTGAVRNAARPVTPETARSPVEALLARQLLRPLDPDTVVLPREVAWRLREGRLSVEVVSSHAPVLEGRQRGASMVDRAAGGAAFSLVHDVELVARALEATPHRPLRTGGIAARDLTALARELGTDPAHAGFVLECAAAAHLVAPGSAHGVLPTADYDRWVARDGADRWRVLAEAWLGATRFFSRSTTTGAHVLGPEADAPAAPALRRVLLEQAARTGVGTILDPVDLGATLAWHRPRLSRGATVAEALARTTWQEAGWLGLVALGGVSSFLPVLVGDRLPLPADLLALFPEPIEQLIVQADLTAVAPGPLRHDVAEDLRLLADQESRGAGGVFRFSATSLRRAFDAGWSGDTVTEWLRAHSSTELPQALTYLVADGARRHGSVRVGPALSFVQTDDEAQAAALLRHPHATSLGLRRLAPGVIVANVEPDELVALLREQGLSPTAQDQQGQGVVAPAAPRGPSNRPLGVTGTSTAEEVAAAVLAAERTHPVVNAAEAEAALDELRAATRDGLPVRVRWVGADGRATERELAPLDLGAGLVRAIDRTNAEVLTIALARIAAVSPVTTAASSRGPTSARP